MSFSSLYLKGEQMARITALRAGRGRGKRWHVFLDGRLALSLEAEAAAGLLVGQEMARDDIQALTRADGYKRCLNAAARYLGYRPRSEAELRERLQKRGFDGDSVGAVLERLKEQGLVDDTAFAKFWKENRESFSPRSRWLTARELQRKGIAPDIIEGVLYTADDDDSAYRAAAGRLRSLRQADYQSFRLRLGEFLRRRGFSYQVIDSTVRRLWHEATSDT